MTMVPDEIVVHLRRSLTGVGELVDGVRDNPWSDPTPCAQWTVRSLVGHLVMMNLVFAAPLGEGAPPEREVDPLRDDPRGAYRHRSSP